MIGVTIEDSVLRAKLDAAGRRLPSLVVKALNDATRETRDDLTAQIPQVFDRPVPLTQKAVFARFASATNQRYEAEVFLRNEALKGTPPVKYLAPHVGGVVGGVRRAKSLEVRLRDRGLLGRDQWLVPSTALPLDQYGNAPRGLSKKVLSQLGAQFDPAANETAKAKRSRNRQLKKRGGRYFMARPGGDRKAYGIWERIETAFGSAVRPVYIAIKGAPKYAKRFDFYGRATRDWKSRFEAALRRRLSETKPG